MTALMSDVQRISVSDITSSPLPLQQSPLVIENALAKCLASSYWNLNYFRRKLSQHCSSEDFSIPARRWYYQKDMLHSECISLSFNKFVDNLTANTSFLQIDEPKELEKEYRGFYFGENTSEDLFLSSGISETFPWPYNVSGGVTTIEIFSPHLVHPLRYDERYSNMISVIKGKLKVIMFPLSEENLKLLKPHPVYGCIGCKATSSEDAEHPDFAGEWNIFRFSRIADLDQYLLENPAKDKIEIDVNAGEIVYIPFNFWYQIRGATSGENSGSSSESVMCIRFRFLPVLYQIFTLPYFSYTIRELAFVCAKLKNSKEAERRHLMQQLVGNDSEKAIIEYGVKNPMEFLLDPHIQFVRRWVCAKIGASFCMTKLDQRVSDADLKVQQFILKSFASN